MARESIDQQAAFVKSRAAFLVVSWGGALAMDMDEETRDFILANGDLPLVTPTGVRLHLCRVGGRIELHLTVGEQTAISHITETKSARLIREWRDRLVAFQGHTDPSGPHEFYEELVALYVGAGKGRSYADLARRANHHIEELVRGGVKWILAWRHLYSRQGLTMEAQSQAIADVLTALDNPLRRADRLVALCRPGWAEAERWECLVGMIEDLEHERPLVKDDYPISREDIRERIRRWQGHNP